MKRRLVLGLALIGSLIASGCTPSAKLPDLKAIYTRNAEFGEVTDRRPLITIPGTLGSRLVDRKTGTIIWGGGSRGLSADPEDPVEYKLITLPIAKGDEPLASLTDGIVPAGILEIASVEFLGVLPLDIDVYAGIGRTLTAGGFAVDQIRRSSNNRILEQLAAGPRGDEVLQTNAPLPSAVGVAAEVPEILAPDNAASQFNTFNFDYDWRRDLIETAHGFGRFLEVRRQEVAAARGMPPEDVRFDLLAHSMGGLLARYFLMYGMAEPAPDGTLPPITWAGAEYFSRVVFVAPPNGGSVIALDNLVNGKSIGPLQPFYPAEMLATHPSPYQLMPRPRHNRITLNGEPVRDVYDAAFWERNGWGLAAPGIDEQLAIMMPDEPNAERRRARALAHKARLLERARQFHEMMDRPWEPAPPAWLDMFLVVGGGFETPARAEIDPVTGAYRLSDVEEGDGVVLRVSALLDERQDGVFTSGLRSPLRFKTTLFLPDEHVELTKNPVFGDNLLFWLVEAPRTTQRLARPGSSEILRPRAGGRPQQQQPPDGLSKAGSDQ